MSSAVATKKTSVARWWIFKEFKHAGTIYSPGEPLPATLSGEELERLHADGYVLKRDEALMSPRAEELLRHRDADVLAMLRTTRAPVEVLREVRNGAARTGRSAILLAEMDVMIGLAAAP